MKIRSCEFEMDGYEILATGEYDHTTDDIYNVDYSVENDMEPIDEELHEKIMDYSVYLLKDADDFKELRF